MAGPRGRDHATLFCDTNVLVRLVTNDPPRQAAAVEAFLDGSGARILVTDLVVAELCYVLTSFHGLQKASAAERILSILAHPSVHVSSLGVLHDALRLWAWTRLGFPDAYLAALDRQTEGTAVLSFDRDFDRIEGVERVDPAQY